MKFIFVSSILCLVHALPTLKRQDAAPLAAAIHDFGVDVDESADDPWLLPEPASIPDLEAGITTPPNYGSLEAAASFIALDDEPRMDAWSRVFRCFSVCIFGFASFLFNPTFVSTLTTHRGKCEDYNGHAMMYGD